MLVLLYIYIFSKVISHIYIQSILLCSYNSCYIYMPIFICELRVIEIPYSALGIPQKVYIETINAYDSIFLVIIF